MYLKSLQEKTKKGLSTVEHILFSTQITNKQTKILLKEKQVFPDKSGHSLND